MMGYGPANFFWMSSCPERGPALKHHHETNCTDGHVAGQCCFCGQKAGEVVVVKSSPVNPPPVDVEARLQAIGLADEDSKPVETIRDYETGARAAIMVEGLTRKQRNALKFLKYRAGKEDLR